MDSKITSLEEKLNQFKLTHRSLNLVRAKDLHELDFLIEPLVEEEWDDLVTMISSFLEKNPKIYLAHYCLAIAQYLHQSSGDASLKIFADELIKSNQKKLAINTFRKVLNYYESIYLVKTLAKWLVNDIGKNSKNARGTQVADELVELRKKILKQDPKDIDTSIKIAEYYEITDVGQAVNYYQMSFLKSFEHNEVDRILPLWNKLIKLNSDTYDFYLAWSKKIVLKLGKDKSKIFIPLIKREATKQSNQNLDYIIQLFKIALQHGIFLEEVSPVVLKAYLEKYKQHSFLNDFLKFFSLSKLLEDSQKGKLDASGRPLKVSTASLTVKSPVKVLAVLDDFEKKIQFDIGRVVKHASFGIGKIQDIIRDKITGRLSGSMSNKLDGLKLVIDFVNKKQHQMSFRIAVSSLTVLSDDHLMVIKYFDKEKFQELVSSSPHLLLIKVLESMGKPASSKEIFSFIEKNVLPPAELVANLASYKKALKTSDFYFDGKAYQVKDQSVSFEAVTVEQLRKTNLLFNQIKIIDFYFSNQEKANIKEITDGGNNLVVIEVKEILRQLRSTKPFVSKYLVYYLCQSFNLDSKLFENGDKVDVNNVGTEVLEMYRVVSSQSMKMKLLEFVHHVFVKDFPGVIKLLLETEDFGDKEVVVQFLIKKDFSLAVKMALVAKENLSGHLEQYVIFARSYLLEGRVLFDNPSRGEVIQNLVRAFNQAYINIERDKSISYHRRVFSLIQKTLFSEHVIEDSLALENDDLNIEEKRSICSELIQLSFLENYLRLEILKLEEKLKG